MFTSLLIALNIYNVASSTCGDYNYAFVLDESGSVGESNYQTSIDFVIDLIDNYIQDTAQLTALAFNSNQDWIYHFSQAQLPRRKLQAGDPDRIVDELIEEKSDYAWGSTGTGPAVQAAINEFVSANYNQNNILILVTDGSPNSGVHPCDSSIINALNNNNIRVIIVGVGSFNPTPVECLVRGNTADIITINDFNFAPVVTQLQAGQVVCNDCDDYNPCTPENIAAGKFHHPSCESCCQFVQCDAWGNMYEMPCAAGTYWNADMVWPGQDHNMGQCTDPGCTFSPNYLIPDQFFVSGNSMTWDEGDQYCTALGADLASVHSEAQLVEVRDLCVVTGASACHIGMYMNEGKWVWSDGSPSDYGFNLDGSADGNIKPPWEAGYAYDGVGEKCQKMDMQFGGYFDDGNCNHNLPAICYGRPPAAKAIDALSELGDNNQHIYNDIEPQPQPQSKNNNYSYYGVITLIGVIAFILINNVFIGCWCLRKNDNKVKFEMVGDEEI